MSCGRVLRLIGNVAINAGGYALGGVIDAAIGAKIMRDAGYDNYDILEAVRIGAAGAVVIGAAVGILKQIFHKIDVKYHITDADEERTFHHGYTYTEEKIVGELVVAIGLMAASGVLGHEMLHDYARMSLGMAALSLTIGASIMAAAFIFLGCCCLSCGKALGIKHTDENSNMPRLSVIRASIGSMWPPERTPKASEVPPSVEPPVASSITPGNSSPV